MHWTTEIVIYSARVWKLATIFISVMCMATLIGCVTLAVGCQCRIRELLLSKHEAHLKGLTYNDVNVNTLWL